MADVMILLGIESAAFECHQRPMPRKTNAIRRIEANKTDGGYRLRHLELLEELETIFFSRGYRAVTMDVIAQELRCSKRALYEIAPNRKALFLNVVRRWAERIQKLGDHAAAQTTDAKARLGAYLAPGVTESRGMSDVCLEDLRQHPQARASLEEHQRVRMARLCDIVDEGIRSGDFANVHARLVAGFCLSAIERINDPGFLNEAGLSFSTAFSELYEVLLNGLTTNINR